MKNKRINIKEEKFRILLENWSRYRSEEISPAAAAAGEAWGPFVFAEYGSTSTIEVIPSTPGQIYYNFL